MMNKDVFEKYIDALIKFDNFTSVLYELGIDTTDCIAINELSTNYLHMLSEMCEDTFNDWIGYWLYELNCGENWHEGCVTDTDGTDIKLETVDDLYDLLVHNLETVADKE